MNNTNHWPPFIWSEDQITVDDHGQIGSQFPRPLSQYFTTDVSSQLINPRRARTYATLEAELASVAAIVESLQELQVFKRQLRNCCIPISALPPEILSEIFLVCFNKYVAYDFEEAASTTLPLILGQVCTFWRTVAWNVPQLWNIVHCRVFHPQNSHIQASLLVQWLNRSKSLPLTIKLSFQDEDAWLSRNAPSAIVDTLLQFSERWENADLIIPISWYGRLRSAKFHSLDFLHLRPPGPVKYLGKVLRGFSSAPKLSIISYEAFFLRYLDLPWRNLTKATIAVPSLDEVLEFLARCPALTYLHIMDPVMDEGAFPTAPTTHYFLESLSFTIRQEGDDLISPNLIVSLLDTPCLRSISFALLHTDNDSPLPSVAELIKRSSCQLREVTVEGPQLDEDDVIYFLGESQPVLRVKNERSLSY